MLLVLATTIVALGLSAAALVIYDLGDYERQWTNDLNLQAEILARASGPALQFNDPQAATNDLRLIRVRPRVLEVVLYNNQGEPFASYLQPGIAAEIREPETDRKLSLHETGMVWFRGVHIFVGYLRDEKRTADVLRDGWFKTGDIGRFDEDGFLYIEGRLSRFSKIGGEMVPHEALDQKIITALGLDGKDERLIAIVGVADETKGEGVLLLAALDVDLAQLRDKLRDTGVPNLWIPKKISRVDSIPVLASGKLDLAKCKELAVEN